MNVGSILSFVMMVGMITGFLYFVDPKTFKKKLGAVVVYLGAMFGFLGFIWFGILSPGIESGVAQLSPSELVEAESLVDSMIWWMIALLLGTVVFSFVLNWYFAWKNSKKPLTKE